MVNVSFVKMSSASEADEINPSELNVGKCKKGERNPERYKQNKIKRSKVKGEEHINYAGKVVTARTTGPDC